MRPWLNRNIRSRQATMTPLCTARRGRLGCRQGAARTAMSVRQKRSASTRRSGAPPEARNAPNMARSSGVGTQACTARTSSALRTAAGSSTAIAAAMSRHGTLWGMHHTVAPLTLAVGPCLCRALPHCTWLLLACNNCQCRARSSVPRTECVHSCHKMFHHMSFQSCTRGEPCARQWRWRA